MKRLRILVPAALLVALLAWVGLPLLASDETRIRWLFEGAVAGFNDTDLGDAMDGFAMDYRDETVSDLTHPTLSRALRYLFLRRVDPKTKEFRWRMRIPAETFSVAVTADDRAESTFDLHLDERDGADWLPAWHVRVTARLQRIQGTWQIHRSTHESIAGERPR